TRWLAPGLWSASGRASSCLPGEAPEFRFSWAQGVERGESSGSWVRRRSAGSCAAACGDLGRERVGLLTRPRSVLVTGEPLGIIEEDHARFLVLPVFRVSLPELENRWAIHVAVRVPVHDRLRVLAVRSVVLLFPRHAREAIVGIVGATRPVLGIHRDEHQELLPGIVEETMVGVAVRELVEELRIVLLRGRLRDHRGKGVPPGEVVLDLGHEFRRAVIAHDAIELLASLV